LNGFPSCEVGENGWSCGLGFEICLYRGLSLFLMSPFLSLFRESCFALS
jgi:hypothetical protein